ncbi:MAG: HAD family phosphatase [Myxococcaceae bacterium]|nr:HAD family phosphatase [Myxococcaceae bacterium]MCA3012459.1 HAD family phosphatase [Myxococcaceae bacterium]
MDALILDLGNVLAFHDNERLFDAMAGAFGTTREAMRERLDGGLWDRVNRGQLPGDALRRALVARLGREVTEEAWFALWNCHFTLHDEMVREVERLVGRVRLVLLSNTHDQHVAWLRPRLPVLERFDGLVLSYEVGLVKPEPAIYARALALAGVPAARAAFFDDVPRYVEAACALGLHGRVFTTAPAFRQQLAALRPDLVDGALPPDGQRSA